MIALLVLIVSLLAVVLVLAALLLVAFHRYRTEMAKAIQGLQLQIAFIAGRIGLRNRDLEIQVPLVEPPPGETEAVNFSDWNDADWMIAQEEARQAQEAGSERP